jgi:hypothetical protein
MESQTSRRPQYASLEDIVARVPAANPSPHVSNDSTCVEAFNALLASSQSAPPEGHMPPLTMNPRREETCADRLRSELLKRHQQQAHINRCIATLSPPPDGRTRVAAVVDLSASALRTRSYPYNLSLAESPGSDGQGSWYTQQHPLLNSGSGNHPPTGGPVVQQDHALFVRRGPLGRATHPNASKCAPQGASDREAHYHREVQMFYEALLEVELDDTSLPSGATKPSPSTHLSAEEYHMRRCVLEERCRNIPMLLSKFHGYEEDLFKMLKAKYNAPVYRFIHFTPGSCW